MDAVTPSSPAVMVTLVPLGKSAPAASFTTFLIVAEDVVNGAAGADWAEGGANVTVTAGDDGVTVPIVVVTLRIVP